MTRSLLIPHMASRIPAATKRRLGLDDARSWIIVTESNRFIWPGRDLRQEKAGFAEGALRKRA
jgi:hypothetical protein